MLILSLVVMNFNSCRMWKAAILILLLPVICNAYKFFQSKIPNGDNVPHPCKPNYIWKGVGHENERGGGSRNPFGIDFLAAQKWTTDLCQKDSDGDGRTNGEELGDPNCMWREGDVPQQTTRLTHPGVCEPFNSSTCRSRNTFVDCSLEDFKCKALQNDRGVRNITIRFPPTRVPAKETSYFCMSTDLPHDGDFHLVAEQPYIDNAFVMHHMILFGCSTPVVADYNPQECGMNRQRCIDIIAAWTVGGSGSCMNEAMGIRIGTKGYRSAVLQIHWNNPEARSDYNDSSGLILHYTSNLRPNDAGVLVVGQQYLEIPPGLPRVEQTAECTSSMTSKMMRNGAIYFTEAWNHMHYLGRQMKIEHFRNRQKVGYITNEEAYSYDSPIVHRMSKAVEFRPGDSLKTTCVYTSASKKNTVFQGQATSDEMCYGFIIYYPKQNINNPFCVNYKSQHVIELNRKQEVEGCRQFDFLNMTHPETRALHAKVHQSCKPFLCLAECIALRKELKNHPCMQGDVNHFLRNKVERMGDKAALMFYFYSAVDSCNKNMVDEACDASCQTCPNKSKLK